MKHSIYFLAFPLLAMATACSSSDADKSGQPVNGQYISRTQDICAAVEINAGKCAAVTIYKNGYVFYQAVAGVHTSGSYPQYVYSMSDFSLSCTYDTRASFSAVPSGKVPANVGGSTGSLALPPALKFQASDEKLDVNGDGILDDMQ